MELSASRAETPVLTTACVVILLRQCISPSRGESQPAPKFSPCRLPRAVTARKSAPLRSVTSATQAPLVEIADRLRIPTTLHGPSFSVFSISCAYCPGGYAALFIAIPCFITRQRSSEAQPVFLNER